LVVFLSLISLNLSAAECKISAATAAIPAPQVVTKPAVGLIKLNKKTLELRQKELAQLEEELLRLNHLRLPIPQAPRTKGKPFMMPKPTEPKEPDSTESAIDISSRRLLNGKETGVNLITTCEPSIAVRKNVVLVTGNYFASFSNNADSPRATFRAIDLNSMFPVPTSKSVIYVDQVAIYDPKNDAMLWLLQHISKNENDFFLRLAVATTRDIASQGWQYYDLRPKDLGYDKEEWFDYPACAIGRKYFYITANTYIGKSPPQKFARSVAMRIPLDKLESYQGFNLDYFDTTKSCADSIAFGLLPVQGASSSDTMYLGSQVDTETLRIYTWPEVSEVSNELVTHDVLVQRWNSPEVYPPRAPSPEGGEWLTRSGDGLSAGWLSRESIGFAWTVPQDDYFRFPHIRVAILNKDDTRQVIKEPHIYSNDFAYAYAAVAPNSDGDVGIVVSYGGDKIKPNSAVGVLGESKSSWDLTTAMAGKAFPPDRNWGDYLTLRLDGRNSRNWVAASFVQDNNGTTQVGYQIFHLKQKPQ
jgi:hypothetical protein